MVVDEGGLSKAQKKRLKEKQKKAVERSRECSEEAEVPEEKMIIIDPKDALAMLKARRAGKSKKKTMDDASRAALKECGGVQSRGGHAGRGTAGFHDPPNWDMGEMGGRQENPD